MLRHWQCTLFVEITCDVQSVVLELGQLHVEFLEEIVEVLSHPILIIVPHTAGESGTSRLVNLGWSSCYEHVM